MEVWGKLYRLSLLREWFKDVEKGCAQYSKTDFLHTLGIISNARRIGVLSKNLYRYYRSPTTQTSIFDPLIHASVPEHLELIRRWLRQFGEISDQNEEFIAAINLGWCERLLNTLENANLSNEMKLKYITGTFGHDEVRGILAHEQFSSQYHNLAACGELIKRVKAYILDLGGNWEDVQCGCVRA